MTNIITGTSVFMTTLPGIAGLCAISLGVYWLFNKDAKKKHLAELRKKLHEMQPTDPEYNDVKLLYMSMMTDAERWGFANSEADAHGGGDHHGAGDYSSHDSGGGFDSGGSDGGGDH